MPIPSRPFQSRTIPLRALLETRGREWPSPDPWAFVARGSSPLSLDTPCSLLAFDRYEELGPDDELEFAALVEERGLAGLLCRDQVEEIAAELAQTISALDERARGEAEQSFDALFVRAIEHYRTHETFAPIGTLLAA